MTPDEMGKQIEQLHEKINTANIQISQLDVKVSTLCTLLEKAAGDAGFNRCSVRLEKINKLEKGVAYITKTGIGAIVVITIIELVRFLMTMHHIFPDGT